MAKPLRPKRGTTAKNDAFVGLAGEITVDTDKHSIRIHDGVTAGGHETITSNGGTVKNAIVVDGNTLAKAKTDDGVYALRGGTTTSGCPRIALYGPNNSSAPGTFMIHANDGVNGDKTLEGQGSGLLTWDGKEVLTNAGCSMASAVAMSRDVEDDRLIVTGGKTTGSGAYIRLSGKDEATYAGGFDIQAFDGTNQTLLVGRANGKLTWGGKDVITSEGGTISGLIKFSSADVIESTTDNSHISLRGGTGYSNGASLVLYGKDEAEYPGAFRLIAKAGSSTYNLFGKSDGSLIWNTKEIERVNSYGTNYIRFESGFQICWGLGDIANGTQAVTLTFPVAFISNTKQIVVAGSGTAKAIVTAGSRTSTNFKLSSTLADGSYSLVRYYYYIAAGYWK